MSSLINFPAITIFARECFEGTIIVGEFRTIILRGDTLGDGMRKEDALREVTLSAIAAASLAIVVIIAVATPLAILSRDFDSEIVELIEGISKVVAAVSILIVSLELPKFLKVYRSTKGSGNGSEQNDGLTRRMIRFNVAWNIWREVAECGVFLIPFFLTGDNIKSLPLSAIIGLMAGSAAGFGVYVANKRLKNKCYLAFFIVFLLVMLSVGLFSGGVRDIQEHFSEEDEDEEDVVWEIPGKFWSSDSMPMTLLKPFGYSDSRTLLQIISFWSWIALSVGLHYRKYRKAFIASEVNGDDTMSLEKADAESQRCINIESVEPTAITTSEEGTIETGHDQDADALAIVNQHQTVEDNETNMEENEIQFELDQANRLQNA